MYAHGPLQAHVCHHTPVSNWSKLRVRVQPLGAAVSLMDGLPTRQRAPPCNTTNPAACKPCSTGLLRHETHSHLTCTIDTIFTVADAV